MTQSSVKVWHENITWHMRCWQLSQRCLCMQHWQHCHIFSLTWSAAVHCSHLDNSDIRSLLPAALTQRLQLSVADARSDLERHSSLRAADLRSELSTSGQRAGQLPISPDRPPSSPASRLPQTPQFYSGQTSALSSPRDGYHRHRQQTSAQSATSTVRPSVPKRPSFSSGGGPSRQHRQAAWD